MRMTIALEIRMNADPGPRTLEELRVGAGLTVLPGHGAGGPAVVGIIYPVLGCVRGKIRNLVPTPLITIG